MTRRRWIADEVFGRHAALTGTHADHLIRVLRARVGQQFDIAAGPGLYRGRISAIADRRVEFELVEELPASSPPQVTLLLAIIKFDRMEWALEKCTELGVSRFIPLIAARSDSHLSSAAFKRVERWKRIAREASEQSRRCCPPEIRDPIRLKDAVLLPAAKRILLSESGEGGSLGQALLAHEATPEVILAVGPEGGWTEAEDKLFRESGWIPASLGQTILRTETAAIAATAIALSQLPSSVEGRI
jgi:16S rRNA (uracil1498-N3)-methyltransferase